MSRRAGTLVVAGVLLALGAAPSRAATIHMSGENITGAVVADLAYFYRHQTPRPPRPPRFDITGGGTNPGLADLSRHIIDAALVSRELEPGDPPGLRMHRLAWSGVCLASNPANPVPGMTRALLQGIVSGGVTSWSQVPGSTRTDTIVPVVMDPGSGAALVFQQIFVDFATPIAWKPVTLQLAVQARTFVRATANAFAYIDLAAARTLHEIPYEGHPCTRASVRDGSYPARRPLGIVTRAHPKKALRRFLAWTRTSRTARRVIAAHYIPAR